MDETPNTQQNQPTNSNDQTPKTASDPKSNYSSMADFGSSDENGNDNDNVSRETQDSNNSPSSSDEWWLDETTKGTGPKPANFNDKTFKNVAAQLKNQAELRQKVSGIKNAPETYDLALGEGLENVEVDQDDPIVQAFQKFSKEANLPQDVFTKGLRALAEMANQGEKEEQDLMNQYYEEEFKKLGADGAKQISNLKSWFTREFPEEDGAVFDSLFISAEAVKLLQMIKNKSENRQIPADAMTGARESIDRNKLRKELTSDEYIRNPAYRAEVDRKYELIYGKK